MPPVQRALPLFVFIAIASCQQQSCPSYAGGPCDPRNADCPKGYSCALAEICTHPCEQASDCWVKVEDGCRYTKWLPGQRLADGGVFTEQSEDGFCSETKLLECVAGYCQLQECLSSPCDPDLYGPSEYKGNRSQGPMP